MTISAYIISKHNIKQANISEPLAVRKEMVENPKESLWIHADDPGNIFNLQDVFGLHPLTVDAIVHRHQPSKIEEYDRYLFTIIDGVRYEEQKRVKVKVGEESDKGNDGAADSNLEEDDLYIFLERRWIITINFHDQQFQTNIKQRISKSLVSSHLSPSALSEQHKQRSSSSSQKNDTMDYSIGICEMVYRFAIEEVISSYYPVIDTINTQLEQIEDYVILEKPTKSQLLDVLLIRRKLSFLESSLAMITQAFADVINGVVHAKLSNDSMRNIRSINDRVAYLENSVENMHQRVINLREAYNSSLSANLNETIRTLTVIATIILPLTLITGIYGMNFDVMPELHSPLGYYYVLSSMGAIAGCMLIYFKKKKWI
ncbi:MAG: magnesium transporter CorA family protein [Nitrososphaeraceae archaeon]